MANNAVKVTDLAIATNAAPSDRLMILRQPVGAPSVRTIAISDLTGYFNPANTTVAGVVKTDGVTIVMNTNGVISSVTGNIMFTNNVISSSSNGNDIWFYAQTAYWHLTSDGTLTYPDGTTTNGNTIIVPGNYDIQSTGNTFIQTSAAVGAKTWTFDTTGAVTFPDSSVQNTAFSTNAAYTFSNVITLNSNIIVKGIVANGSLGTNGQFLISNGSVAYWASDVDVSSSSNPNTHYVYSANYLASANDNFIVVNNNGADRTIYLPNSGITEGKTYTIKKGISFTSSNTIVSANGLLIDGSANVNINSGYGYVTLTYSNSTGTPVWWITSKLL
jgi:hypothetical protein